MLARALPSLALVASLAMPAAALAGGPEPAPTVQDPGSRASQRLPAIAHEPPPAGYRVATRPVKPMMITGGTVLGVSWLAGAIGSSVGLARGEADAWHGFVPLAGPWIALATGDAREPAAYGLGALGPEAHTAELVVEGLVQAAGLGVLIAGAVPRTVWVKDEVGITDVGIDLREGGAGLRIAGRF